MTYQVKKNDKYLSELFPVKFNAINPLNGYFWSDKQRAQDIATNYNAELITVNN